MSFVRIGLSYVRPFKSLSILGELPSSHLYILDVGIRSWFLPHLSSRLYVTAANELTVCIVVVAVSLKFIQFFNVRFLYIFCSIPFDRSPN